MIIDQRKIDEISERSRIGFPEGALLDSELTGRWREVFSGRVIIDGGERGREITFLAGVIYPISRTQKYSVVE